MVAVSLLSPRAVRRLAAVGCLAAFALTAAGSSDRCSSWPAVTGSSSVSSGARSTSPESEAISSATVRSFSSVWKLSPLSMP